MYSSPNHAQAILDVFSIAISDLVSMGLTEQEAISGLLGQASVRVDHPAMELALNYTGYTIKTFQRLKFKIPLVSGFLYPFYSKFLHLLIQVDLL